MGPRQDWYLSSEAPLRWELKIRQGPNDVANSSMREGRPAIRGQSIKTFGGLSAQTHL